MDDTPLLTPFFYTQILSIPKYFLVKFTRYLIYGPFRKTVVLNRRNIYYSGMINKSILTTG